MAKPTQEIIDGLVTEWLERNNLVVVHADLMRDIARRLGVEIIDESDRRAWVAREVVNANPTDDRSDLATLKEPDFKIIEIPLMQPLREAIDMANYLREYELRDLTPEQRAEYDAIEEHVSAKLDAAFILGPEKDGNA